MPLPVALDSNFYKQVWEGELPVKGATRHGERTKQKSFFALLEVGDQCKHDNSLRGYCRQNGVADRRTGGSQVHPTNNEEFGYYESKGEVACKRVASYMHDKWDSNDGNNTVFDQSSSQPLSVQSENQSDGWCYEITMYYRGSDVYVTFHCYPP
jgi:hypothetical protein